MSKNIVVAAARAQTEMKQSKKPDLIVFCSTSFCNHKQVHAFIRACIVKITMLHEPNFSFYIFGVGKRGGKGGPR